MATPKKMYPKKGRKENPRTDTSLTQTEELVMFLTAYGLTQEEISQNLEKGRRKPGAPKGKTPTLKTIQTHKTNARKKLDMTTEEIIYKMGFIQGMRFTLEWQSSGQLIDEEFINALRDEPPKHLQK
jgi:DNA-binding CsgD family transcriptional regulator